MRLPQDAPGGVFSIVTRWLELIREGRAGGAVFDWANWDEVGTHTQYLDTVLNLNSRERIHDSATIEPGACVCEDCMVGKDACITQGAPLVVRLWWPRTHVEPGRYRRQIVTPRLQVQV